MNQIVQDKLKQVPTDPGVYQFLNSTQKIIYIGKAKNLRNRVRSYFQKSKHQSPKNVTMVCHITDLEWIVVRNEVEALMTEANLIKTHHPRYNIDLRDDKTYPFIRITNEPFPQVVLTRKIIRDGSKYYGPFTDVWRLRMTLKALYKVFPIRSCSFYLDETVVKEKKVSLCLDYHIKKCEGPCEGLVSQGKYLEMVKRIEEFMKGKTELTESYISDMMKEASSKQNYEEAAMYRDQLNAILSFKEKQSHVATDFEERDVIALAREGSLGVAVVLRIRNGRIFSRDKLSLKQLDDNDETTLKTIVTRFYMDSDFIPREMSFQVCPLDEKELNVWLKKKRKGAVRFLYPKKGEKAKELRITLQNARLLLGEWIINREKRKDQVPKMLDQLQEDLSLDVPPRRIEVYDNSHIQGSNSVGALITFGSEGFIKKRYRKFNIKSENIKNDDYAMLKEVLFRRFSKVIKDTENTLSLPDLVLIDGGKGQYSVARKTINELGLYDIPIIAIAKGKLRNSGNETFFFENKTFKFSRNDPILFFLQRLRDEAHRFAVSAHRDKRIKGMKKSLLDQIGGIGKIRKKTLLNHFGSARAVESASLDELKSIDGIELSIAKKIHNFFHS